MASPVSPVRLRLVLPASAHGPGGRGLHVRGAFKGKNICLPIMSFGTEYEILWFSRIKKYAISPIIITGSNIKAEAFFHVNSDPILKKCRQHKSSAGNNINPAENSFTLNIAEDHNCVVNPLYVNENAGIITFDAGAVELPSSPNWDINNFHVFIVDEGINMD